ncbi:MAG: 4-hydroxybenzoate octaprenyltransferase [Thiomicrospira sp.]|jgi:4-hydroxybenzoate polyprenyltransferase|nr:4-hydroxybenzoate octaprenyltransferase [Thiomicrospira sp.]
MRSTISPYIQLMRLDKPVGIYLVLWPALWALWLAADGFPPWPILAIFIAGAVVMRSAGCVINDYADRHWDGAVARTCARPLVTGALSVKQALGLFVSLIVVAFVLVLALNDLTQRLAVVALVLAALYPFMKRYTYWPQLFLGAAFAWAIPMAYAAVQNSVPYQAWWVFIIALIWTLIYDTLYAMADRDDDLKVGIKSTAILFGRYDRLIIGLLQLLMIVLLLSLGTHFALATSYFISVFAVALLFAYHQYQIRQGEPRACFDAFKQNHWAGLLIWLGLVFAL